MVKGCSTPLVQPIQPLEYVCVDGRIDACNDGEDVGWVERGGGRSLKRAGETSLTLARRGRVSVRYVWRASQ